jgi:serine/threonine protein kinase
MAPEQIEHPAEVDLRADLYSLGVIFYEMLTGELPLGRFPLPSQKSHTDVRLDQVVLRALEKEPDRRYQRASEILTEVQSLSAPATAAGRVRKMAAIYQAAMACALVLIAGLVYALVHRPKGPPPSPPPALANGGPGRGARGPGAIYLAESQEGLSLTPRAISELGLKTNQVQLANVILHTIYQDFSQIQRKYTTYAKGSDGHVHVSIKPLEGDDVVQVTKMRENLWKELASVLTPAQIDDARNLPGDPFNNRLLALNTNQTRNLEYWKDNNGEYHSVTDMESARNGETIRSNTSTNINLIPRPYRVLVDPGHARGGAGL